MTKFGNDASLASGASGSASSSPHRQVIFFLFHHLINANIRICKLMSATNLLI